MFKNNTEKELVESIDQIIVASINNDYPTWSKYYDYMSRNNLNNILDLREYYDDIAVDDITSDIIKSALDAELNMIKSIILDLKLDGRIVNELKVFYKNNTLSKEDVDKYLGMFIDRFWVNHSMPFREISGQIYLIRSIIYCEYHRVKNIDLMNLFINKVTDSLNEIDRVNKSKTAWQLFGYIGITIIAGFLYSILGGH